MRENVTGAPSRGLGRTPRLARLRAFIRTSETDLVLETLDLWIEKEATGPDLWAVKAIVLKKAGKVDEAAFAWRRAVELHPRHDDLVLLLAGLAREQRQDDDEMWALGQALSVRPEQQALLTRLFILQIKRGDIAAALVSAERLVALNPDHEPHLLRRATCLVEMGRMAEAETVLSRLVAQPAASDAAVGAWSRFMVERYGRPQEVVERLAIMATQPTSTWIIYWWLGKALAKCDRLNEAIAAFKRAAELAPGEPVIWHDLATVERYLGLAAASQASFSRSLEIEPNNPTALRVAGYEHKYNWGDAAFRRVTLALARVHRLPKPSQVEVHYAVAKAMEDVGELDAAFEHYARAGQLQKVLSPWTDTESRRLLATLKREFTPPLYRSLRDSGYPSSKAVFVVGMPRSGTSLIEQVIASHPHASGVGEVKAADAVVDGLKIGGTRISTDYPGTKTVPHSDDDITSLSKRGHRYIETIEAICGRDALRIVDKRPGNFVWIGMLEAAMPGSYFIHSRRHPVDTCLSAYRLYFGGEVPFSYDLRDLGRAFRIYHAFMEYWSGLMPADRLLQVRHEDVVADFEGEVRRMLEFIELPWNDACLGFFENHRAVRTASAIQVRRPIFRKPSNRWRDYQQFLGPLLDELGDLVPDYEKELADHDARLDDSR